MEDTDIFESAIKENTSSNDLSSNVMSDEESKNISSITYTFPDDFEKCWVLIEAYFPVKKSVTGFLIFYDEVWYAITWAHGFVLSSRYIIDSCITDVQEAYVYLGRNGDAYVGKVKIEAINIHPKFFNSLWGDELAAEDIAIWKLQNLKDTIENKASIEYLKELELQVGIVDDLDEDTGKAYLEEFQLEICWYPGDLEDKQLHLLLTRPRNYSIKLRYANFDDFTTARGASGSAIFYRSHFLKKVMLVGVLSRCYVKSNDSSHEYHFVLLTKELYDWSVDSFKFMHALESDEKPIVYPLFNDI